jgi:uncharacterized protein (TIGR02246 family)
MTRTIYCCITALALSAPALAQEKPAAPGAAPAAPTGAPPEMTKMGPMSRPVTKPDKKGVDALFKAMEDGWKKGDINVLADMVDFPVIMLTDDSTGTAKSVNMTREQWVEVMRPMLTNMPKDAKMTHKHDVTFLSDTLAVAIEDNGLTMGKTKGKWKSMSVLTQKDGKWKFKEMAEAGWGDMPMPGKPPAGGPSKTPTTTPPVKAM